jgi:hypothetical protein
MEQIDINQANDNFDYTVSLCTSDLLNKAQEIILYKVYEEFDSCSWSFLHENTLNTLLNSKLINEEIFNLSVELRALAVSLFNSDIDRTVEELNQHNNWRRVFALCDEIIELKKELPGQNDQ